MKLSEHIIAVYHAFEALISSIEDLEHEPQTHRINYGVHDCCDLLSISDPTIMTQIPTTYQPIVSYPSLCNKEKLLQLAAFEATYQDAKTSTSPDMMPLIIDRGTSITLTPYKTDFISPIKPV
jgi:hypothetical protein